MAVVYKTFKTPINFYIYDRSSNSIITISEEEYKEFNRYENNRNHMPEELNSILRHYQENSMLMPSKLDKISNVLVEQLDHYLQYDLERIVLQVTQNCNLRCEYCAYSGSYYNRVHKNKRMSWETAKDSIDFAMQHSVNSDRIGVSFYGGEPLLEFELIKKCIAYIKENYFYRDVILNMTTNATIMSDEIITMLIENNIFILVSLDGPEEVHDKNRRFMNNKGSFETIMGNLEKIMNRDPEYFKTNISFNSVVAPEVDFKEVIDFFKNSSLLKNSIANLSLVSPYNSKIRIEYSKDFVAYNNYQRFRAMLFMIDKIEKEQVFSMYDPIYRGLINKYEFLKPTYSNMEEGHHSGPCTPGVDKLFVNADGNFYPCERVNENAELNRIGSVKGGYNIHNIKSLINIGKITENECKLCWNFFNCNICSAQIETESEITKKCKLEQCALSKTAALLDMIDVCTLKELGCDFEEVKFK